MTRDVSDFGCDCYKLIPFIIKILKNKFLYGKKCALQRQFGYRSSFVHIFVT